MGTKRVGLARIEALMEGLKREIDFSNTTLKNVKFTGTITRYGQEINQMSLYGLNPIWAFNFGDPSVRASDTEAGAKNTVLTPDATLFNLSLALTRYANQSAELTVAQSTELLGSTASASTSAAIAAGATNVIMPDNLNVTRVTGNLASTLTLTASTIDYQADESFLMIFKGGNVFTASQVLTLTTHADAELNAEGCEVVVSGAGTNKMTRQSAATDADNLIILTASAAATTILEGSYIYGVCENNTDAVTLKACIRTTGGTIAVTFT